jgi:hypothetical protein
MGRRKLRQYSRGRQCHPHAGSHLRVRENGAFHLHHDVKLDTNVWSRSTTPVSASARVAPLEGTIFNAGRDGRGVLMAGYCIVNASDHGIAAGTPIRELPFVHLPIRIFEECGLVPTWWLRSAAVSGLVRSPRPFRSSPAIFRRTRSFKVSRLAS